MATVVLERIGKSYGSSQVLDKINLRVEEGEFVVLVGPSGCGKTTLLRMIAGLEDITTGDLIIDGKRANDIRADERRLAMVFQSYALYPHMTVADNMSFALRLGGSSKTEREKKVADAAKILQIDHLLQRRPGQLSGGQRQRVAIGRAIVREPALFLFDEPLSNLDASLRIQMRIELARLHRQLSATMIYVTHDQVEAMTMADRIVILNRGHIEQVGTPSEVYHDPKTAFVAGFMGSPKMNLLSAEFSTERGASQAVLASGQRITIPHTQVQSASITVGIRPESVRFDPAGSLRGEVSVIEDLGGETLIYVDIGNGALITVKTTDNTGVEIGETVGLAFDDKRAHVFGADGNVLERRLNSEFHEQVSA